MPTLSSGDFAKKVQAEQFRADELKRLQKTGLSSSEARAAFKAQPVKTGATTVNKSVELKSVSAPAPTRSSVVSGGDPTTSRQFRTTTTSSSAPVDTTKTGDPISVSAPTESDIAALSASDKLKVEAQMAQDQQDLFEAGGDIFGEDNPIEPSSLDIKVTDSIAKRKAAKLIEDQKSETEFLAKQQAAQEALDVSQFGRLAATTTAAIGATKFAFAEGRRGVQSATSPQLIEEFAGEMASRVSDANIRLEAARRQRDRTKELLLKAQQQGRESLVEGYSRQLAAAEAKVRERDTAYIKEVNTASKNALDLQFKTAQINNQAFNVFEKMPIGGLQDMEIVDISAMMGVSDVMASTFKSLDKNRSTLNPNDPNYAINKAKQNKIINEARWAGMTSDMKNFAHYQDLLGADPAKAELFAQKAGFSDSVTAKEEMKNQLDWDKFANKFYADNGIWPSKNGTVNSDGSIETSDRAGEWGGQCGKYVNDYFGSKLFKNSLSEKLQYNNSDKPVVGGAFISKYGYDLPGIGQTGHVGLITKVYEDGSFDIQDSNRNGDELIDTSHVSSLAEAGIVGFFDPGQEAAGWTPGVDAPKGGDITAGRLTVSTGQTILDPSQTGIGKQLTEKDAILSQIRAGNMTNTEISKSRNKARNQGWLDEFVSIQNSPKIKAVTEKTATKFGVPQAITQFQLDDILAFREAEGFGNRQFQAFVNDTVSDAAGQTEHDKLVRFIQLKDNLEEAQALFTELKGDQGNFLQDVQNKSERQLSRFFTKAGFNATEQLQKYNRLKALTGEGLAQYVKEISGAAVSEQEFVRLQQNKPNVSMDDQQFANELERMLSDFDESMQSKTKRFAFDNSAQMKDVILGRDIAPSTIPEEEPIVEDPLGLAPGLKVVDPLGIRSN